MTGSAIKRVAVIGAGPAGAITVDALAQEKAFDHIRVFERRECAGGCWIGDTPSSEPTTLTNFAALAARTADAPLVAPSQLPAYAPKSDQPRFDESSLYPYLETNVDKVTMEFTQEPIADERSERSIGMHGPNTPFRHWSIIQRYIQSLLQRNGYEDLVSYNTYVERVEKVGDEWKVTLRKPGREYDYWWTETFDAVVVAVGHYWVPYIPRIDGLDDFEKSRPGSVLHSKLYRGKDYFAGKRVVTVGASVSAADISVDLVDTAKTPIHSISIGHTSPGYFGTEAFNHPRIHKHPSISHIDRRTVHLVDGNAIPDVDHIIFGTGYSWTYPFLKDVPASTSRVVGLYQHVVWSQDPSLMFVGAVGAGFTFKIFEWQAVYAARLLSGHAPLPSAEAMRRWEEQRLETHGDRHFSLVFPDFEDYFDGLRELAGEGQPGVGRKLPKFRREWYKSFLDGTNMRVQWWVRENAKAIAADNKCPKARL